MLYHQGICIFKTLSISLLQQSSRVQLVDDPLTFFYAAQIQQGRTCHSG